MYFVQECDLFLIRNRRWPKNANKKFADSVWGRNLKFFLEGNSLPILFVEESWNEFIYTFILLLFVFCSRIWSETDGDRRMQTKSLPIADSICRRNSVWGRKLKRVHLLQILASNKLEQLTGDWEENEGRIFFWMGSEQLKSICIFCGRSTRGLFISKKLSFYKPDIWAWSFL